MMLNWLVVWNIFFMFHHIWENPSHWRTPSFFKMVKTTNQLMMVDDGYWWFFSLWKSNIQPWEIAMEMSHGDVPWWRGFGCCELTMVGMRCAMNIMKIIAMNFNYSYEFQLFLLISVLSLHVTMQMSLLLLCPCFFTCFHSYFHSLSLYTLWWTNIAMENHHFFLGKSTINGDFPLLC